LAVDRLTSRRSVLFRRGDTGIPAGAPDQSHGQECL
jgi:hypothetical protein